MKIFARQVNPEYQDSMFFEGDGLLETVCFYGNKSYHARMNDDFERVLKVLDSADLEYELDKVGSETSWYSNATEAINDLLPKKEGKYSTHAIHDLKELVSNYDRYSSNWEDILCNVLSIVTGKEWDYGTIHGSYQGDWNYAFYLKEAWTDEELRNLETMYFNTGSEWIIHDEETEPETAEDISGFSVYCCGWNDDQIKQEIANAAGGSVDDVILYKYAGSRSIPVYEMA